MTYQGSTRRLVVALLVAASIVAVSRGALAQVSYARPGDATAAAQAIMNYWTPERMAGAQPMPSPGVLVDTTKPAAAKGAVTSPPGVPTLVAAHPPGQIPATPRIRQLTDDKYALGQAGATPMDFGSAPTEPLNGPYGPFQRWTMEGNYLVWPRSVHGKLFFTHAAGGNYVCSATVIGRSTLGTAGHCVSNGSGSFHSNFLFCPSHYQLGPYPTRGCWAWSSATTSADWHFNGNPDADYACLVTTTTGTVVAGKIGNTTGTAGIAYNWTNAPEIIFGYPAGFPFSGNIIHMVATVDWYGWDADELGGQVSKIVGNDLTGGSSGGGWFLGWRAPGAEVADTDASWNTDPTTAGPYLNGVNSHKRCKVTCNEPPALNNGVFWQEMSSPPFRWTGAVDEAQDIFDVCLAHVNNNP